MCPSNRGKSTQPIKNVLQTIISATPITLPTLVPTPVPVFTTSTPNIATVTVSSQSANLRSGPGATYPVTGSVIYNMRLRVIAQAHNNSWYLIEREDGRRAWISASVVIIQSDGVMIEAVATIPVAPIVQSFPIPVNGKPVISKAYTESTCSSHYYVVVWNDPDGDAIRIDYLNQFDNSVFGSGGVSGTGGEYHTETYTGCSSSVCGLNFVVIDQAGNRSNIKGGEIHCG